VLAASVITYNSCSQPGHLQAIMEAFTPENASRDAAPRGPRPASPARFLEPQAGQLEVSGRCGILAVRGRRLGENFSSVEMGIVRPPRIFGDPGLAGRLWRFRQRPRPLHCCMPIRVRERAMQYYFFHLMSWPYLPDDFAQTHDSAWVWVPNSLYDPVKGHASTRATSIPWPTPTNSALTASVSTNITRPPTA